MFFAFWEITYRSWWSKPAGSERRKRANWVEDLEPAAVARNEPLVILWYILCLANGCDEDDEAELYQKFWSCNIDCVLVIFFVRMIGDSLILSPDVYRVSNDDESRGRMSCMSCQEKSGLEIKKIRLSLQDTPGMLKMCTIRVYAQHIGHLQDEDEDGDLIWWLWSHVVGAILIAAHWFDFWKSIPCDVITLVKQESWKSPWHRDRAFARNAGMLHNNVSKKRLNI